MRLLRLVLCLLFVCGNLAGESVCPQPPILTTSNRPNIFSEEQEVELGEVASESFAHSIRVIEDESLTMPLRRIGARVTREMPSTKLQYRFFLIDEPYPNAFAVPGGRVYVTRKLIATTRSEDELAGVLAHEVGHQLNHDSAVYFTKLFNVLLDIKSVGDREDIENKYHLLLDNFRKREARIEQDVDKSQLNADQVAVFAVARAGYDPSAVVNFWDRMTERKGRKGGWLSDMFGSTAPETKRLREFANTAAALPASCIERTQSGSQADYGNWKQAVLQFNGFGKKENVPNLVIRKVLEPSLQGEIKHLRFSPDGRYVMAQDEASIFVLQREPLSFLFRIDARDAYPAHFTPDSQSVVFHNEALRVFRWDVARREQTSVQDVQVYSGCMKSLLSPDGSVLACFKPDNDNFVPVGIRLIDVQTGENVYEKAKFVDAAFGDGYAYRLYKYLIERDAPGFSMDFSSDGRYFLAGLAHYAFGYDLRSKEEIKLPSALKAVMKTSFSFMGPDRVIGIDGDDGYDSKVVRVPTGEVLQSGLHIGPLTVEAPTMGDFAVVRPLIETPAGIMDLKENKIFLASKTNAVDVYDGTWVSERANGEVALYKRPSTTPLATVKLPRGPLRSSRVVLFSEDLSLLAVSDRSRGKLWDIAGVGAVQLGGFNGAYLGRDELLVDFAPPNSFRKLQTRGVSEKELRKEEGDKQGDTIARMDLKKKAMTETAKYMKRHTVFQTGSAYLVAIPKDDEKKWRDVTLEAHDFATGQLLWKKLFKRLPSCQGNRVSGIIAMIWDLRESGAKEEIKQDPEVARLVQDIAEKEYSYLVVALDVRTGKAVARFPIDTGKGSYRIRDSQPSSSVFAFLDSNDRVLVYNLQGKRIGRFFGRKPALSSNSRLLALEREPGRLALYDLVSMKKWTELTFDAGLEHTQFSGDGKRLAVLTEQQEVYIVDLSAAAPVGN